MYTLHNAYAQSRWNMSTPQNKMPLLWSHWTYPESLLTKPNVDFRKRQQINDYLQFQTKRIANTTLIQKNQKSRWTPEKLQYNSRRTSIQIKKTSRKLPEAITVHSRYTPDTLQIHSRYTPETLQKNSRWTSEKSPVQLQKTTVQLQKIFHPIVGSPCSSEKLGNQVLIT